MTTSLQLNRLKCMNPNHFKKSEELLGYPVTTDNVMNAFYDKSAEIVTLKCYWCDYSAEVDVSIRPVQVQRFGGKYTTIGPAVK